MAIAIEPLPKLSLVGPDLPPIKIPGLEQVTAHIISPTEQPPSTDPELVSKKIPGSEQVTTAIVSPTEQPSITDPELVSKKIPGSEQVTTPIVSPTEQPSSKDSELLAKRIAGSLQLSKYYENYNPDYEIKKSLLGEPTNRKIRILNVGTGLFSINLAYYISTLCENFELTLVEKSHRLGGVWNHNRYPGIACDVPSHIYQYSWAPNPDWPRFLSSGDHIQAYLETVSDTFDLKKYMQFNSEVTRAQWVDDGFWRVTIRERQDDGSYIDYQKDAEIFVNNSGTQHKYQWPKVEGADQFLGKLMHTANWDSEFGPEAWKDKTVCVIGSGASAVQVVPQMQPHVKKIVVFSRTPVWFAPGLAGDEFSPEYSTEEREVFRHDPSKLVRHSKEIERKLNRLFHAFYHGSEDQKQAIRFLHETMKQKIRDPELLKGITPEFAPGCRRITPGDPFIHAIQHPNAEVVFKSVRRLTKDGVVDTDGVERSFDVVICATGFNVDYTPPFDVYGRNSVTLAEIFAEKQDNYMGISIPGFPNMFCGSGPYWTTANGSLIDPMNTASKYVVQVIQKLQFEHNIVSVEPTQEALDDWVEHAQTWVKGMVWSGDCPAWYKVSEGKHAGRTNAVWPGITLHMVKAMSKVRWEDYNIERRLSGKSHTNRFQFLGHGLVKESVDMELDDSPHFSLANIDPRWTKATRMTWVPGMQAVEQPQANGYH